MIFFKDYKREVIHWRSAFFSIYNLFIFLLRGKVGQLERWRECCVCLSILLVYAPCTVSEIRAFGCQHTWWDRRSNYFMLKEFFAESHKLIRSNLFMLNAIHGGICTISNHPRSNHTRSNHPRLNHTRSNHPSSNHPRSNHTRSNHPRSNHTRSNHPRSNHTRSNHTFWCHTRTVILQSFLLERSKLRPVVSIL